MNRATAPARSGITQTSMGDAYIPSSTRADGSKRKEIRVRPGYIPPEDVETYKNQRADAFKNRGKAGIPGAEGLGLPSSTVGLVIGDGRSKNAKRREAAKAKRAETQADGDDLVEPLQRSNLSAQEKDEEKLKADWRDPAKLQTSQTQPGLNAEQDEAERQKKIRNTLKKLKAVRELKDKKAQGEKLSADQIAKMRKEPELVRDLVKWKYEGPEMDDALSNSETTAERLEAGE